MDTAVHRLAVVLVDDDDLTRRALARMLVARGAEVAEFAGAADALAHLVAHGAGLLVTDLEMPGMDGAALIAATQTHGRAIRIVLISGASAANCQARLAARGVAAIEAIEAKPISFATSGGSSPAERSRRAAAVLTRPAGAG